MGESSHKVLLVEDEPSLLESLVALLQDEGYQVRSAPDGRAALRLAREERPDVVVTDWMMPHLDGLGLLAAMAREPALAGVPAVVMSAVPRVRPNLPAGAQYLPKPFDIDALLREVSAALARAPGGAR